MHYIVFDLEWNIAGRANKVAPEDAQAMPFEIIEIGAVKLDENFETINKFSVTVKPKLYPVLSGHVAAVTRRLQQSMKSGVPFTDAARDFLEWCGEDYIYCSWSESDASVLKQNLAYYDMPDKLSAKCLDVQYLFDQAVEKAGIQRSVEYALDFLNIDKNRPFHQAVQDAWYTGRILKSVAAIMSSEQKVSLSQVDVCAYAYDPDLTRSYQQSLEPHDSLSDILNSLVEKTLVCPACNLELERVIEWKKKGNKYTASFICSEHGSISGRTKIKIRAKERVSAHLTMRLDKNKPLTEN